MSRKVPLHELASHVRDIARAFNLTLVVNELECESLRESVALFRVTKGAPVRPSRIVLSSLSTEGHYAVALHELGHAIAPGAMLRSPDTVLTPPLQLMEEESAWTWARAQALTWTPEMEKVMRFGLESYRHSAREYEVAKQLLGAIIDLMPPPPPPPKPKVVVPETEEEMRRRLDSLKRWMKGRT